MCVVTHFCCCCRCLLFWWLAQHLVPRSMLNQLPAELKDEMQEHLRLKFNNQEASDDQVRMPQQGGWMSFDMLQPLQRLVRLC